MITDEQRCRIKSEVSEYVERGVKNILVYYDKNCEHTARTLLDTVRELLRASGDITVDFRRLTVKVNNSTVHIKSYRESYLETIQEHCGQQYGAIVFVEPLKLNVYDDNSVTRYLLSRLRESKR